MIYGYARVSTDAQDLTIQRDQLTAAGCERIYSDKFTGTDADRPQLKKLMAALGPGDTVIIPAVDRLARDPTDLLVIARDMRQAGAGLKSLAETAVDTTSDFADVVGDKIKFQNGFGAWRPMTYFCAFDTASETVVSVHVIEGRID